MKSALIGFTGFVGSILFKQKHYDKVYNSKNISEIESNSFDLIVCAGASGKKWKANQDPYEDFQEITRLISHLKNVDCKKFILISTVDVFKFPEEVDENTNVDEDGLHAYGLHRRLLEKFIMSHFSNHLVVRLPGLIGPGLRKNVIYDFLNDNNLNLIDSRSIFQFYPMMNLWADIQKALDNNLKLIHLTAEPISVSDIASKGFDIYFKQVVLESPVRYDMKTVYFNLFDSTQAYQYSAIETILAIRLYAKTEPKFLKGESN